MSTKLSIDMIPLGVLVYRYEAGGFICVDANAMTRSLLEMENIDIIGLNLFDIFEIDDKSDFFQSFLDVYKAHTSCMPDINLSSKLINKSCTCQSMEYLDNGDIITFFHDVHEDKVSKTELETTEKAAHIGNWHWNMLDNSIVWSDEVYRIFGEEPQSFTPTFEKFLSFLPAKDQKIIHELIENSIQTREPYIIEHEIITAAGELRYAQGSGHAKFDASGKPIGFSGTVFDITATKESHLKLVESEEKFRKITEVSLMGIFLYKEHYIYANDAFCNITGYSLEELKTKPAWFRLDEKVQDIVKERVAKRLQGEEFEHKYTDLVFTHKNGQKRRIRVLTQTIFYQGSYAGLGTVMDITDIQEDKERLRLLAQAVEQTDEMIRITDKEGVNTYVNDALVLHTGYRATELIGQNNRIFKSGIHSKEFYEKMWSTILSGKSYKGRFCQQKERWAYLS